MMTGFKHLILYTGLKILFRRLMGEEGLGIHGVIILGSLWPLGLRSLYVGTGYMGDGPNSPIASLTTHGSVTAQALTANKEVPVDSVVIPVKAKPQDRECGDVKDIKLPIVPPHELAHWLLRNRLIQFDKAKSQQFWQHHRERGVPWMSGPETSHPELAGHYEPVGLYADEAEYTVSKEKITILFLRALSQMQISIVVLNCHSLLV